MLTKKLSVGAMSVALFGCGGGNESDPKLTSDEAPATGHSGSVLSGVVLDGYLYKANVCLDKNNNAVCDSSDGTTVLTDQSGQYTLPFEGNAENYNLLVEAIANVTIDMDSPNQTLTQGFTLEIPSSQPGIISPMTSMVASLANRSGITFDLAAETIASELNVSSDVIKSDYVAQGSKESREIHMLARGITRVLQSAQASSVEGGVSQELARKGSIQRLANLDVAQLKFRTDQISHGADNEEELLAQIDSDYREHLKIKPEDLDGDNILTRPRAPRGGVVNDAADTFDWQFVPGFKEVNAYEFSLDRGQSWQPATSKPINVGAAARSVGDVQVRTMAKPERSLASGMALLSTKAFTTTLVPAAPISLTLNDADNSFDWQHSANFQSITHYEYTLDGGKNWHNVTSKPQNIADIAIPVGDLKLRVKSEPNSGRPAGHVVKSDTAMTVTPDKPVAPVLISANDDSDILAWENVSGFDRVTDYQINLGSGWQEVLANPYQIGNVDIPANTIHVRVKANPINGRDSGESLLVTSAFNKVLNKPIAPTLPVINDADNLFNWTSVDGYPNADQYEYSLDSGISYRPVTSKPQSIPDEAFKVAQVCVRIKASADDAGGESLCSDKVFTVTPNTPSAPTNGLVNDALNTFNWDWVAGFDSANDYEYRVDGAGWSTVQNKPLQLEDKAYGVSSVEVRVKYDPVTGRLASPALSNTKALTKQPEAPVAPTSVVVDDTADTLDWAFVTGFSSLSDYEWSINQGTDWTPVLEKPVVVGDVAKSIGQVQVRVRANGENGMLAGAHASNGIAFTELPKLPALTGGNIVIGSDQANTKHPNLIAWDFLSTTIANKTVTFDQPEYYEFTVDQGASWKPVTSVPQFIGTQAYAKDKVGVRVKKSAFPGLEHPASKVLWASSLEGKFVAIQYVPMVNLDQVASFNDAGWKFSEAACLAEYNVQGTGEPIFWSKEQGASVEANEQGYADLIKKVQDSTVCGISQWQLPSADEVKLLTARQPESLPKGVGEFVIAQNTYSTVTAKAGKVVAYSKGEETSVSKWSKSRLHMKWLLESGQNLLAKVEPELSSLIKLENSQTAAIQLSEGLLPTWLNQIQGQSPNYGALQSEVNTRKAQLESDLNTWQSKIAQFDTFLAGIRFDASMAKLRTDADSLSFVGKVGTFESKLSTYKHNLVAIEYALRSYQLVHDLAGLKEMSLSVTQNRATLDAASTGEELYLASLGVLSANYVYQAKNSAFSQLVEALLEFEKSVDEKYRGLISAASLLVVESNASLNEHDNQSVISVAKNGLNQAHASGYSVNQTRAMINSRYAKLDLLGRYMPATSTYAQGWRCVLDVSSGSKNRVWTLLQDGKIGGNDHVAYNLTGTETKSLNGSGGYLELRNIESLCGFSDWKVPNLLQLKIMATVAEEKGLTLDSAVFPHHPKSPLPDGVKFYYWSDAESSTGKQNAYSYASEKYEEEVEAFSHNYHSNNNVTLARLVREDTIQARWIFLTNDGNTTLNKELATCVKNEASGEVWQLFDTNDGDARLVNYALYSERLSLQNSEKVCGLSNWRLPSIDELSSLMPLDEAVFTHSVVKDPYGVSKSSYLSNQTTSKYYDYLDLKSGEYERKQRSSIEHSNDYLYRFISK
ncbi:MAG: DUF1566 domain-containing protein [Vibrio sp.]|uniref:DUF1566 domain-containing protein n=1 Tax=Vibrio TaxID=662 RepID=UPI001EC54233|nr:DUF1566 domain-containing protein [Vibrio sp.]NRB66085.1 DUF1566 domain-containing protein [Vibrio sp.]